MAYQTRGRDPLLDSKMAEAIEKRGKELLGVGLIALGLMAAMMIGSYTPDDPNWMVSTDAPAQNWLGRMGASLAAPLFMIVGWGAWAVAAILLAWGVRFALHRGAERAMGRLIFAPIGVALCSIYGATLTPDAQWLQTHSFGLGGLFGDTVMGAILTILPIGSIFTIKMMSVLMGVAIVALGAFVMGFTRAELSRILRFMLVGVIMVYAGLMNLLGRGASGAVAAAQKVQARQSERRERSRIEAEDNADFAASQAQYNTEPDLVAAPKKGLLAKMPALVKRSEPMPEPELLEDWSDVEIDLAPSDDRIKSKIADVIKSRVRTGNAVHTPTTAPLTRGRGRGPDPLVLDATVRNHLREEPPLTGASRVEPPLTVSGLPNAHLQQETDIAADFSGDGAEVLPLQDNAITLPVATPRKVVQQPARKVIQPSKKAQAEAQPGLTFEDTHPGFELPPLNLLESPDVVERLHLSDDALEENARMLESVLDDYGVKGEIVAVRPGPVVTMYELEPAPGLKASRVIGLADDIARSMAALSARVSTVPGRSVIGIELPNENREKVVLREILSARDFGDSTMRLPLALGKDIGGDPVVANLAKMPHLLIAGTTGSGKSVAINTMILSLLYKLTPEECRMIMIDPKMLELSVYDGIPHLLSPVVTDPKKAVVALKWTVGEMEERYRKMSKMG
ncbi:MAG: DNA translocase FtsK 4TM domain-containing protein, partial [Yoonia sp.]